MAKNEASQSRRIVKALTGARSAKRRRGVTLAIEYVLAQPVESLVDTVVLRDLLLASITESNTQHFIDTHGWPGHDRVHTHLVKTGESLNDLLPDDFVDRVEAIVRRSKSLKAPWAKDAVDPALVRSLIAPVVQQTLTSFVQKLPIPGLGGDPEGSGQKKSRGFSGAFRKSVSSGAGRLAGAGANLLGGLGAEIERKLQSATKEFSQTASSEFRSNLRERLRSDEGREMVRQIRDQALSRFLETPLHEMMEDMQRVPLKDYVDLAPPVMEYNRKRKNLAKLIDMELSAWLKVEGKREVRELLEEAGLLKTATAELTRIADAHTRAFFGTAEFAAWVEELLEL